MKNLLSTLALSLAAFYANSQCTVTLNPSTTKVTQDSTIATNEGATQFYLVCEGVTLTYDGTQSADVTYYLEDAAKVVSGVSHEAILYMKRLSSIDANYSQSGQWAITNDVWHDPSAVFEDYIAGSNINECTDVVFNYGSISNCSGTTSLETLESVESLRVHPNPASDNVVITTGSKFKKTIIITNVLGEEVNRISNDLSTTTISINELKSGTYFVILRDNLGNQTIRKLVINR
jgi:hypothetical protein